MTIWCISIQYLPKSGIFWQPPPEPDAKLKGACIQIKNANVLRGLCLKVSCQQFSLEVLFNNVIVPMIDSMACGLSTVTKHCETLLLNVLNINFMLWAPQISTGLCASNAEVSNRYLSVISTAAKLSAWLDTTEVSLNVCCCCCFFVIRKKHWPNPLFPPIVFGVTLTPFNVKHL